MKFSRILTILLVLLISILGIYLIESDIMPKYNSFFLFFIFLIIGDFYVWSHIKKGMHSNKVISVPIRIIYWMSVFLLLIFLIGSILNDIKMWNHIFRTYLIGIILVLYVPKLIIAFFILISDLLRLFKFLNAFLFNRAKFHQKFPNKRWKSIIIFGYFLGLFTFVILIWGMIYDEFNFEVKDVKFEFSNLPQSFDSLKIVQISDIHIGSWYGQEPLDKAIQKINGLSPDIVLFTGDIVNFSTQEVLNYKENLRKVKAPLGVYAVLGNHDYGEYTKWVNEAEKEKNMQALYDFYKEIGWKLLKNESIEIINDIDTIQIVGVENWGKNPRFPQKGNLDLAFRGMDSSKFSILLSHDPTFWQYIISKEYHYIDLTLSGHTHAMQMGIKINDFEWSPSSLIYKFWAGKYKNYESVRNQYLYVNRGLGIVGYPGRIGIKPEITLITLFKQN